MNQHFYIRQGMGFKDMTESQRESAFGMMRASLSAKGLKLSRDIMKLNHTLGELNNNNFDEYGEWLYYITVMGEPSEQRALGLADGRAPPDHQLFRAGRPGGDDADVRRLGAGDRDIGKYAGTDDPAGRAEQEGWSSSVAGRDAKEKGDNRSFQDGEQQCRPKRSRTTWSSPMRVCARRNSPSQEQTQLLGLVAEYVDNMDDGHAKVKMEEVRKQSTKPTSRGSAARPGSVFYYRIHSPVILIEFDHQQPVGIRNLERASRRASTFMR